MCAIGEGITTMKAAEGLITKLIIKGVIETRGSELRFTDAFCSHLAHYSPEDCFKAGKNQGWRKMFQEFKPALGSLHDDEIAITIALLDYFLNTVEVKRGF